MGDYRRYVMFFDISCNCLGYVKIDNFFRDFTELHCLDAFLVVVTVDSDFQDYSGLGIVWRVCEKQIIPFLFPLCAWTLGSSKWEGGSETIAHWIMAKTQWRCCEFDAIIGWPGDRWSKSSCFVHVSLNVYLCTHETGRIFK